MRAAVRRALLPAALLLAAAPVYAQFPVIDAVRPLGARRGTEVEIRLSGRKLGSAVEGRDPAANVIRERTLKKRFLNRVFHADNCTRNER